MSVAEAAHRPAGRGSSAKLWLGVIALIAAGVALAWLGAGQLRGETTASGLQFRTVEAGSGALIRPQDGALIEYEGRLLDGTVFDSSEGRGPTPIIAGQSIPGFSEAMSKMQSGGRYRIRIPGNLAYGATPPPGSPIPPNAELEFDVKVVQVIPDAARMMAAQPGPPPQQ
jgi:FKBP-type peptidyl-prolyl cis-trans isomerase FkpA